MKDAQKEVDAAVKKAEKGTKVKVDVTPDISNTDLGKKNKKDKSKSKDSKQEIDWIARKLEVLQKAIDTTSGKLQNLFSIKAKKNNINKQITETSFINAWKTDNKMKNFVSDVVTGAVTGDNSKAMRY